MADSRYAESLPDTLDCIRGDVYLYEIGELDYRTLVQALRESMRLLEARIVTHGRHCRCSACAREDWTRITSPCGMHGPSCPSTYAPLDEPLPEVAIRR